MLGKRTERLADLMRETEDALTSEWKPSPLTRRFIAGHLLQEGDVPGVTAEEMCERFMALDEVDQEKFWANVEETAEWDNYLAGGPEPRHWNRGPARKPLMRPPDSPPATHVLTLEQALSRLGRIRPRNGSQGQSWRAICPLHGSLRSYSLIVSESSFRPGTPVFYCYAGCGHQEIYDALLWGQQ